MRAALLLVWAGCNIMAQSRAPAQLFRDAVNAEQRGDLPAAVLAYRELLKSHPEAGQVHANLGNVLAGMGNFDEAIEQYRAALTYSPKQSEIHLNLAFALHRKGDFAGAAKELAPLYRAKSVDRRVVLLLGDCYSRMGRDSDAIAILLSAEAAHAGDSDLAWELGTLLIQAGRPDEGVKRIEKLTARGKNIEAEMLAAETRLRLDQYDQALRHADAALRIDSTKKGVHTLRGLALEHLGDFPASKNELELGLRADPNDSNAHLYLGAIFYFERELGPAREHLEQAVRLDPSSALARYQLGLCKSVQGDLEGALADLKAAEIQTPEWAQPHVALAALYYRLELIGDGARERAIVNRLRQTKKPLLNVPVP